LKTLWEKSEDVRICHGKRYLNRFGNAFVFHQSSFKIQWENIKRNDMEYHSLQTYMRKTLKGKLINKFECIMILWIMIITILLQGQMGNIREESLENIVGETK